MSRCILRLLVNTTSVCLLCACGSSSSGGSGGSSGFVQIINGMEDSPTLFAEIEEDGDLLETVNNLGFRGASSLLSLGRGAYEVDLYFEDPDTGFNERLLATEIDVQRNTVHLGILSGSFADPQFTWVDKPDSDVVGGDDEEVELQALNLSSDSVSVYLGDEDDGLNAETLVATVAAGIASDPVVVEFDDDASYTARVTLDGDSDILYDSGTISIPEATRRTLVVTDATGPDPATKSLFVVSDAGTQFYANGVARSGFRVINALSDAGDIRAGIEISSSGEVLADATLLFGQATDLTVALPTFVDAIISAPSGASDVTSVTASLNEDTAYTFIVGGSLLEDDVAVRVNELDLRTVAISINVHLVNTLGETDDEDISEVDFYALPLGESLSDIAPAASGVGFLEGVSRILPATAYDLVVTTAGTQSILAGPARIFPGGGEQVLVVAAEAAGGGEPYQVLTQIEQ